MERQLADRILKGEIMAQNVIINGVTYQSVPEVDIPKSGGGTAKFYDTASADVDAASLLTGISANILTGKSILGVSGSLAMPSISQDSTTKILSIS